MKKLTALLSFACVCIALAFTDSPRASFNDPADVAAVKQIEEGMGRAMIAADIKKLSEIYADDFATIGSSGEIITKKNLLTDFESFHDKLEWFENGPIDVQVLGNVAVAQGTVKEKRSLKGKNTSGAFAWMDLLKKRGGKWVVLRSASARLASDDSTGAQSQDPNGVDAIKKFEQAVGDAMVARDIDKLTQSYADDWTTVGSDGKIFNRAGLLSDFKSGNHTLVSFELGPMDVQVLGDVAVAQASVAEKRIQGGKDISGQFVFMDLLKKRGGQWVIVRTLGARVG